MPRLRSLYTQASCPRSPGVDRPGGYPPPGGPAILAQHPLGRIATPDEIAAAVEWLALDAPAVLTGSILDANGASYLRT